MSGPGLTRLRPEFKPTLRAQVSRLVLGCFCVAAPLFAGGYKKEQVKKDEPIDRQDKSAQGSGLALAPSQLNPPRDCFDLLSQPGQKFEIAGIAPANHSPSLTALANGKMLAVWFGGEREGARDVSIYASEFQAGVWTAPRILLSRDEVVAKTGRFVQKLGNPVAYRDRNGLHLWVVAVSLGGWGGSRVLYQRSQDEGITWSVPQFLVTSPFMNVSTLVRSAPVSRETSTLLPAYFELSHKYPMLLKLSQLGQVQDRIPIGSSTGLLQPSLAQHGSDWRAYMRRAYNKTPHQVFLSRSSDEGRTWSVPEPLPIPNPDSSVAGIADQGGSDWLALNASAQYRQSMHLVQRPGSAKHVASEAKAIPSAPSSTEPKAEDSSSIRVLESAPKLETAPKPDTGAAKPAPARSELSYPNWAKGSDGSLHLAYTADARRKIHHWVWPSLAGCPP